MRGLLGIGRLGPLGWVERDDYYIRYSPTRGDGRFQQGS